MSKELQKSDANKSRFIRPAVDINEDENCINLYADMPGVKRENLKVETSENKLTISGKISAEVSDDYADIKSEFRYSGFKREFSLSKELDANNITANLKNGVLHLNIPKKEEVKPKIIEIKTE